jgi:hypothetical protein
VADRLRRGCSGPRSRGKEETNQLPQRDVTQALKLALTALHHFLKIAKGKLSNRSGRGIARSGINEKSRAVNTNVWSASAFFYSALSKLKSRKGDWAPDDMT